MTPYDAEKGILEIHHRDIQDYATALETLQGTYRLYEDINDDSLRDCLRVFSIFRALGLKEIRLLISSQGGSAYHAFGFCDGIKSMEEAGIRVIGVVEGLAASAANMVVLQSCTRRLVNKHARLHLHEVRKWVFFEIQKESDVEDEAKEMRALTGMIIDLLSLRTGKSKEEIHEFIERRERWMSAKEALEYGLVDEII